MSARAFVVNTVGAIARGIQPDALRRCAEWNGEAAMSAYAQGDMPLASRLWWQSGHLARVAAEVEAHNARPSRPAA